MVNNNVYGLRGEVQRIGDRMDGFVERMAAVENEMKKLTDIAVVLARYDERILAVTTRLNLMDKRREELRHDRMDGISSGRMWVVAAASPKALLRSYSVSERYAIELLCPRLRTIRVSSGIDPTQA